MAEKLRRKIRCAGIDLSDVISSKEGVSTAVWVEQPLTLRDDALTITPASPTETTVYSHENDIAEDYDAIGNGRSASGSFFNASFAQMKDLLGGEVAEDTAMFLKSGRLNILNKAIRFRLKDGGAIIIPNARGYVDIDINAGATDGMLKCPFVFQSLAQVGFDCDLIILDVASVGANPSPLSAKVAVNSKQ